MGGLCAGYITCGSIYCSGILATLPGITAMYINRPIMVMNDTTAILSKAIISVQESNSIFHLLLALMAHDMLILTVL